MQAVRATSLVSRFLSLLAPVSRQFFFRLVNRYTSSANSFANLRPVTDNGYDSRSLTLTH